jgi:transcriptional regulator with XRE-family HTH domain
MLSDNLRRYRAKRGWSRRELSRRSGVHINTITDIELDKSRVPAYDKLVRLAMALDVTPEQLMPVSLPRRRSA